MGLYGAMSEPSRQPRFPYAAGILFGLGLGGFFDGIVFHQLLQWHHMLSSWYPDTSIENLRLNTLWDGIFHSTTFVLVAVGFYRLWRTSHRSHLAWSSRMMAGTLLLGWGVFNIAEGLIDHELLGVHHVNETVPKSQWIYWDMAFLAWGLVMLLGGWTLLRLGQAETRTRLDDG